MNIAICIAQPKINGHEQLNKLNLMKWQCALMRPIFIILLCLAPDDFKRRVLPLNGLTGHHGQIV
jgi:hypothetical protein